MSHFQLIFMSAVWRSLHQFADTIHCLLHCRPTTPPSSTPIKSVTFLYAVSPPLSPLRLQKEEREKREKEKEREKGIPRAEERKKDLIFRLLNIAALIMILVN